MNGSVSVSFTDTVTVPTEGVFEKIQKTFSVKDLAYMRRRFPRFGDPSFCVSNGMHKYYGYYLTTTTTTRTTTTTSTTTITLASMTSTTSKGSLERPAEQSCSYCVSAPVLFVGSLQYVSRLT